MSKANDEILSSFGLCTHGRNWGFMSEVCGAEATHQRRGFPEKLACWFHAFDAKYSTVGDPDWIEMSKLGVGNSSCSGAIFKK